jgi:hypothetical protein
VPDLKAGLDGDGLTVPTDARIRTKSFRAAQPPYLLVVIRDWLASASDAKRFGGGSAAG